MSLKLSNNKYKKKKNKFRLILIKKFKNRTFESNT